MPPTEAVLICTRNRPADLLRTLRSVAAQQNAEARLVVVVDASDAEAAQQNEALGEAFPDLSLRYVRYDAPPSSARQRNRGLDRLPPSVTVVHFIDDDMTVRPGYFRRLAERLRRAPAVGGAGGLIREPGQAAADDPRTRWVRRLFLLASRTPGRVLPSGFAVSAQTPLRSAARRAPEWLSGCASYRRTVLDAHRFDDALGGYALFEDLDLSYRVGRAAGLALVPEAQVLHHRSPHGRHGIAAFMRRATVHRYWFIRKNRPHAWSRPAFWWSVAGRALLLAASRNPDAPRALRGLLRGARDILLGRSPLLRSLRR